MNDPTVYQLTPLRLDQLAELEAFWRRTQPLHPVSAAMLRDRLFLAPGQEPDLLLAARGAAGQLVGFAVGAHVAGYENFSGSRWLGIDRKHLRGGAVQLLLDEMAQRLAARGVTKLRMMGTPPYYFRPGVDTRETDLISVLLGLGWVNESTNVNMTVDLAQWASPGKKKIFGVDEKGYRVRRATAADRDRFDAWMAITFPGGWQAEAPLAFANDPITLFLAVRNVESVEDEKEEIVGFAAYEVSQCLGGFGPTGVTPTHRGAGLGSRLLMACLDDLQRRGEPVCEIGWVGPVPFYHWSAGAILGPVYWWMSKSLE